MLATLLPLLSYSHRYIFLIAGKLRGNDLFFFPDLGIHVDEDLLFTRKLQGWSGWLFSLRERIPAWPFSFKLILQESPLFFFGQCCARHNDSGSHENMLNWSSVDNSIAQIGQWTKRKQKQNKQNRPNNQTQTNKS